MIYRLVTLLALLALIVGVVVLTGPQRESIAPATAGGPLHDPGYSALKAHLIQTGADGFPVYTLDAAQIQEQPDTGLVNLQQVFLTFRDDTGNEWRARAASGELAQHSGVVRLAGDVHVNGIMPGTSEPAELVSEHLAYDSNTQVVSTADPFTLVMSGRRLSATGLLANLKGHHLKLESAVHGSFQP
jgi:LPS export ABC transporter protein LptC